MPLNDIFLLRMLRNLGVMLGNESTESQAMVWCRLFVWLNGCANVVMDTDK